MKEMELNLFLESGFDFCGYKQIENKAEKTQKEFEKYFEKFNTKAKLQMFFGNFEKAFGEACCDNDFSDKEKQEILDKTNQFLFDMRMLEKDAQEKFVFEHNHQDACFMVVPEVLSFLNFKKEKSN